MAANDKGKRILWVDDEIGSLKAHCLFLESKGYRVVTATNGTDAVTLVENESFDLVLVDEMMAGLDGLATIEKIKRTRPSLPIVMVTKSEEEQILNTAIGRGIDNYITKPVSPLQILSAVRQLLDAREIKGQVLSQEFASEFNRIRELMATDPTPDTWYEIASSLAGWDRTSDERTDIGFEQLLFDWHREANREFAVYVERNYLDWVHGKGQRPVLSTDLVTHYLEPLLKAGEKTAFVVIDCMRLDQYRAIEPLLTEHFEIDPKLYFSILPSATPYSRNAIFSGLWPLELSRQYPELWRGDQADNQSRNRFERQLLTRQLLKLGYNYPDEPKYVKILDIAEGENLAKHIDQYYNVPLVSIVVNFLDILAHGRSESDIIREIAPNESAFRSLMRSWFQHSSLFEILKSLARQKFTVLLTTDHGSILGKRGSKVFGKRDTSTNLRYKYWDNLGCDTRQAILVKDPSAYKLPRYTSGTTFVIAKEDFYFIYPTNFAEYQRAYHNSFQHGGVSLEEMILPVVTLRGRG